MCIETWDTFLGSLLPEPLHGFLEVLLTADPVARAAEVTLDVVIFSRFDVRVGGGADGVINPSCASILNVPVALAVAFAIMFVSGDLLNN